MYELNYNRILDHINYPSIEVSQMSREIKYSQIAMIFLFIFNMYFTSTLYAVYCIQLNIIQFQLCFSRHYK